MQPSGVEGALSSFFVFTDAPFGDPCSEIDIEFIGGNTTEVLLTQHTDEGIEGVTVNLGFDAALAEHTYAFEWGPNAVSWFADDVLLHTFTDPSIGISTSITATDTNGATATVNGPDLTLDTATPALSFAGETRALSINLTDNTYAFAKTVLTIGDSLTHGFLGLEDQTTLDTRDLQAGYRDDLFEGLLGQGAWIDYVGRFSTGSDGMLDTDHSGQPGARFRNIVQNGGTLDQDLAAFSPDIVILRAGTNDFNRNVTGFFAGGFPTIVSNVNTAIAKFFAQPGSDEKHLIISTVPPNIRFATEEFSRIVNEGYSTVNGQVVVGDAGNGTYQPGIIATVQAQMAAHPTLHIYEAPFDVADLGPDDIHLTDAGYARFATGLQSLIETEIGLTGGTINGTTQAIGASEEVEGGEAGDLIVGSSAANIIEGRGGNDVLRGLAGDDQLSGDAGTDRLEGGAGVDTLIGGLGADNFIFNADFATGHGAGDADAVLDFGTGVDRLVFLDDFLGDITVTDVGADVVLTISDGMGGTIGEIEVSGAAAQALKGADLGGGVFDLTTDDTLVAFVPDPGFLFA